jgi:ABC-2 type transport system ATP-binding protein
MEPTPAAIEVDHVSRWYGNIVAVNDVTFSLEAGIAGLLGPNGAGKSTLLHMLAGFLEPSSGQVKVLGEATWANPEMYRKVGLVPEREAVYPFLSGYEFVLDSARLHGLREPHDAALRAIRMVELEPAMDRATGGYSKGMKQRIKIAAALVHEPEILLLDEPFNGADPRQRLQLMDMLKDMAANGRTIVFSSHILEEVERLADDVLVIVSGRLAASGDFREIRKLMTDRPHTFFVRASDNRRLAANLVSHPSVYGVQLAGDDLQVSTSEFAAFTHAVAGVARKAEVSIFEIRPTDESLESVFSYLVKR